MLSLEFVVNICLAQRENMRQPICNLIFVFTKKIRLKIQNATV